MGCSFIGGRSGQGGRGVDWRGARGGRFVRVADTPHHTHLRSRASSYAHELGSQERKLGRIEQVPDIRGWGAGLAALGPRRAGGSTSHGPQRSGAKPRSRDRPRRRPSGPSPGPRGGSGHPGGLARPAPPQPLERRERALVQRLEPPPAGRRTGTLVRRPRAWIHPVVLAVAACIPSTWA